ncbi:50S ribosomal protein L7/L12 [bacterium]|nr:50S ribosomal protein L7/L12 [bacterium]
MAELSKEDVINYISNMTVMELSELVKELESKFGVSAAAPMPMMMAGAAISGGEKKEEEKTEFTVNLTAIGDKKIQVIKEVRALTGLGLKEAKDLVEGCPKPVKENVPKEEAQKIKETLEKVGATVEIK